MRLRGNDETKSNPYIPIQPFSGVAGVARTISRLYGLLSAFEDSNAAAAIEVFAI